MPIGERQPRPEKIEAVAQIRTMVDMGTVFLTDFTGLNVKRLETVRQKLREANCGYRVVKNTLFTIAVNGTPAEKLAEGLAGSTAMVYTADDPVAAAKALQEFLKGSKPIIIKSGIVEGQILNDQQIVSLAKIPPKHELYAMVVGGLKSPITGLVGTLQQMTGQLVMTLQAVADKKAA